MDLHIRWQSKLAVILGDRDYLSLVGPHIIWLWMVVARTLEFLTHLIVNRLFLFSRKLALHDRNFRVFILSVVLNHQLVGDRTRSSILFLHCA